MVALEMAGYGEDKLNVILALAFKSGTYKDQITFTTKDIYAHVVGIEPTPNNPTLSDVFDLFA